MGGWIVDERGLKSHMYSAPQPTIPASNMYHQT